MLGILSALIKPVFNVIDKLVPDKDLREKLKHEIATQDFRMAEKELEARAKIIATEASSAHKLAAIWRPITMLIFAAIVANNYLIYPYLSLFWSQAPQLDLSPEIWNLLKLGIGGYIVGRSAEKCVKTWKEK